MLETTIVNTVDRNKLTVNLPIDFEELQERFVEKYGYCTLNELEDLNKIAEGNY